MRVGLFCIGIGAGADPQTIQTVAQAAERTGFSSLWSGEHVAHFDPEPSPYPYTSDGSYVVPVDTDLLDPFIAQTWAAAVTSTIRIGTAMSILPQRQPVVLAKQIASIDHLSGGRFTLGAGLGWSRTEYAACGVPWERRGERAVEYVEAMRALWDGGPSDFDGKYVRFQGAYCRPAPAQGAALPVHFGGLSEAALRRAAQHGDGWHALGITADEAAQHVERIRQLASEHGRSLDDVEVVIGPAEIGVDGPTADDIRRYADAGADELTAIEAFEPAAGPDGIVDWVEDVARRWVDPALAVERA